LEPKNARAAEQPVEELANRNIGKVAMTALAGTSIEWYDFFLYGTAAALIFPTAFFPADMPPFVALIASFSTFAIGFLARPLGGIIFGHFGDTVGRKKVLVVALLIMGVATTAIGFLPTYHSIGIAAPLILVFLRFVQGLAIGGQWGGATLLVTESAPPSRRGFYGAFAQAGAPAGVILANLAFLVVSNMVSEQAFADWGWRIPFAASAILIGISIYVQVHLEDTPAFKALEKAKQLEKEQAAMSGIPVPPKKAARSPILEAIRRYPGRIMLAACAFLSIQVSFYILIAFVVAYGASPQGLGLTRNTMLSAVLIASAVQIPIQFWAASFSDRFGRKGIFIAGAVLSGLWGFALFPLLDTRDFLWITVGITGGLVGMALQYGPQAAFFTELFSTNVRYSGASLGYQIGAILGGALAPLIATMLWKTYGIIYVGVYIAIAAVVTVLAVLALSETRGTDLNALAPVEN
jgi:MFS family permease